MPETSAGHDSCQLVETGLITPHKRAPKGAHVVSQELWCLKVQIARSMMDQALLQRYSAEEFDMLRP